MRGIWTGAGGADLEVIADAGLLSLSPDAFSLDASGTPDLDGFVNALKQLLANPNSHLLFDQAIIQLVDAMVREDVAEVNVVAAQTAKKLATGTRLIERLPTFPNAPIDELIRTKSDLSEPLVRYRGAVKNLSSKLTTEPFDPSLNAEIDELWYDEVAPSLQALRDDLGRTRLVSETAKNLATDVKTVVSGGVGVSLLVGVQTALEQASWTAAVVGAGGGILETVKASREPLKSRETAKAHELYYLHAVNQKLGGRR